MQDFRDLTDLLSDSFDEAVSSWLGSFSNYSLFRHIGLLRSLFDSEVFTDCLLFDLALKLVSLMEEECIRRIGVLGQSENSFGSVVR